MKWQATGGRHCGHDRSKARWQIGRERMRIIAALPGTHSRATWRPDFGVVVTVVYLTYRPQHLSECPSGTCRQRDSPPTCQTYILHLTQNITQDGSDRYTDRLTDSTMYPVDIKLTNLPAALRYLPGDKLFPKITGWSWLPGRMRCKETTVRWQGLHSRHLDIVSHRLPHRLRQVKCLSPVQWDS